MGDGRRLGFVWGFGFWRIAVVVGLLLALSIPPSQGGRVIAAGLSSRAASAETPPVGDPTLPLPKAKYLVLIVLDGARPDYLNLTRLPHVDALRAKGTQFANAIDGILESETPAGHTTLATGSPPSRNGILGFDWAQNDKDYSLFSPTVVRAGAMEHIMANSRVPTIAGLYKARYPKALVVALSGNKYYAADPLGGPQADAIMYFRGTQGGQYAPTSIPGHVPPAGVLEAPGLTLPSFHNLQPGQIDHLATLLALSAFAKMHQRLTLINYPEFDWPLGHVYGGISNRARAAFLMKVFDRDLGSIERAFRRAGVLDQTLFVITADHGMGTIWHFVPDSIISNAVASAKTTAPAIAVNTGAYVWLQDPTKAQAVAQGILASKNSEIESAYYLSFAGGKPQYILAGPSSLNRGLDAANRALLATLLNGHEPNVVAFCRRGATFTNPNTKWKADHGGPTWASQHIPLILAGPGIQPGLVVRSGAELEDVAPTILTDMGVAPSGMEGHVLTEALVNPPSADQAPRQQEIRQLAPMIAALQADAR